VSGARSEPPTPRRLAEARRRGQVAVSRNLTGAVALAAGAGVLALEGAASRGELVGLVRRSLQSAPLAPEPFSALGPAAAAAAAAALGAVARLVAWPALAAALAGAICGLVQTGGLFAPRLAAPQAGRLDPGAGIRRLFGRERLAATGLSLLQAVPAALLLAAWLRGNATALGQLPRGGSAAAAAGLLAPLAGQLLALLALLGALDLLLARRRHRRSLAMTRDEVRREQREEEGDPGHRAERRRRHRDLALAAPVASATCVLVNPTRLAVALHHERGRGAPRVVAKGAGPAARRLRSAARLAGVPIVREVALARALHRQVEVGEEIPEALYDAAAAVLAHLAARPAGAIAHGGPP